MASDLSVTFNPGLRTGPANIDKGGWDLWRDHFVLGMETWPFSWVGVQGVVSIEQTAGTEAVLGSRRWLGGVELSPRLRLPVRFLDHLYVSPAVRAAAGKSWLNFGGGTVPEAASDFLLSYGGRGGIFMAITEDVGVDVYAGFESGRSVARSYREESYFAGVGLMLGRLPSFEKIIGE